jgi:Toprim-like
MSENLPISTKKCLICNQGKRNDTLHWHSDSDSGDIWVWCNKCSRGYSIYQYCALAGLSLVEFLKNDFEFEEAKNNEVQKMAWPKSFIPLYDPKAQKGVDYIKSRGLDLDDGMYYDTQREGIVFPLYYDSAFCGAQVRLIEPWVDENGDTRKIDTIPGTRLGLLWYNWNGVPFRTNVKALVICEGAFNACSLQQALNSKFGVLSNPFKVVSCSGSGISKHHIETMTELKNEGIKIIAALDADDAGMKGLQKMIDNECVTHYALTDDTELDWNDLIKQLGKEHLATFFLKAVKKICET